MNRNPQDIIFDIDIFTPRTLPMSRLAEYLARFSEMLGHEPNVHFSQVTEGSARCHAFADPPVVPKIRHRVESVLAGDAPKTAMKAHKAIDDLLAADNAIGSVYLGKEKVIEFPGRRRAPKERIGPVRRSTTIEGQIFSIGGKDETINVHLREKESTYRCEVSIELARKLAPMFLAGRVRMFGHGDWYRVDSKWQMESFFADDFVPLEEKSLQDTLASVREFFSGISPDEFVSTMSSLRHE